MCIRGGGVGAAAAAHDAEGQGGGEVYSALRFCAGPVPVHQLRALDPAARRWQLLSSAGLPCMKHRHVWCARRSCQTLREGCTWKKITSQVWLGVHKGLICSALIIFCGRSLHALRSVCGRGWCWRMASVQSTHVMVSYGVMPACAGAGIWAVACHGAAL